MTAPKYELVITGEIEVTHPRKSKNDASDRRQQKEAMRQMKLERQNDSRTARD